MSVEKRKECGCSVGENMVYLFANIAVFVRKHCVFIQKKAKQSSVFVCFSRQKVSKNVLSFPKHLMFLLYYRRVPIMIL